MTGAVFTETLRRAWRPMLWWGLGLGFMAMIQIAATPSNESLQQMTELLETLPPFMLEMFGAGDTAFLATTEGYLALQLFAVFPLILAFYGVTCGMNVVSNEEERGIMDSLLSMPIERWKVVLEKCAAYALTISGVVAMIFAGVWIGILITPSMASVNVTNMLWAHVGMIPVTWGVFAFTVLTTGLLRRRGLALTLAAVFVLGSYFLDTLGKASPGTILGTLRPLSVNAWYDYQSILQNAMIWGNLLVLVLASAVMVGIGMFGFQRRDVGI